MDKKGIRNLGKLLRKDASCDGFEAKAYKLLSALDAYKKARCIMLYLSLGAEAPTDEIIRRVLSDGKRVCVPVTEGHIMTPVQIDEDTSFKEGAFKVREPVSGKEVKKEEIDLYIIPGLLFGRRGERCGYGKGCYDYYLEDADGVKVGLSFDKQLISAFPVDGHDVKMDYIITEKELVICEKGK